MRSMASSSRRRARSFAAIPLFLTVVVIACFPGPKAPEVPPNGTLDLRALGENEDDKGPLKVVFASPKGKLDGPSEITVLFNKPLRSLDLAGVEPPFPAEVLPKIDGTWQWAGTRAGTFVPARAGGGGSYRLPKATTFSVKIPKGTKALDGDVLAADYAFTFETERPRVVRTSPYQQARGLKPDATFELYFDQSVDAAEVQKNISLTVGKDQKPFTAEKKDPTNDKLYLIKPAAPLALASHITIRVKEGFKGKEGPLPLEAEQSFGFETYGPLTVEEVRCGYEQAKTTCNASGGLRVSFSNPAKAKDIKKAISVDGGLAIKWPS